METPKIDDTLKARLAADPHRPVYHFLPPANWMNDPNGLIQWKGTYHMFYQHNPYEAIWGPMYWGHGRSTDLVHWEHLPIALAPSEGPDKDGCWSGCAVDDQGVPTFVYTGVKPECQCLAIGSDDLITWQKPDVNPVVPAPPDKLEVTGFRDPCVWREGDTWYMVIGSGIDNVGGAILLYRSTNLRYWEYLHPALVGDLHQEDPYPTGIMWECPQFFPLDDKWVLIVSAITPNRKPENIVLYFVGTFKDGFFTPESTHKLDYGDNICYAPQVFQDEKGGRIMFGWIREIRSQPLQVAAGWSGAMTLPVELTLEGDCLAFTPLSAIKTLRQEHFYLKEQIVTREDRLLNEIDGNSLEILADFKPDTATTFGLKLCCSPDGHEYTSVFYDTRQSSLVVDTTHSSLDHLFSEGAVRTVYLPLNKDDKRSSFQIHAFLDHSVLEVFIDRTLRLTTRLYPRLRESQQVRLFAEGGAAVLQALNIWSMKSAW